MDELSVLVSLHRGYGLGDAVQTSVILQHLRKYRPSWKIDFQAEDGRHQVGRGIVHNTFAYGQPYPSPHYDSEYHIVLYDNYHRYVDKPNTHVSSALRNVFDIDWDETIGSYHIYVSREASDAAWSVMPPRSGIVAMHFEGDTAQRNKNLTLAQAQAIRDEVWRMDKLPLLLDWRGTSKLYNVNSTGHCPWSLRWGADVEMNCAVISNCNAFIGIDSGPGKCASATNTPTLIIWTGHHPALFHDPASNTTHLVPQGFHGLRPVCNDPEVVKWFDAHYNVIEYKDYPVSEVRKWLRKTLT